MSEALDLYESDFARWAETQARALRDAAASGANLPVDWSHVAEEIEALARRDRREIESRLLTIHEHLLKLFASPAIDPRAGWKRTVLLGRKEIALVLRDSPSLRREVGGMVDEVRADACDLAIESLKSHGEMSDALLAKLHGASFTEDQILGDWFPDTDA